MCELWQRKTIGVQEEDLPSGQVRLRAFFYGDADPGKLLRDFSTYQPSIAYEEATDWTTVWQPYWNSRNVGDRFFLVPSWSNEPTPGGRLRLNMHPGLACGTGAHPATQLCIEALERYCRPGIRVLDVGTGSGILSVAAIMLGAELVIACDIDPISMDVAAARFHLEAAPVRLIFGSVRSIRDASIDLIVMNINAPADVQLAPEIARILTAGGLAVLSGFPALQSATVSSAAESAHLRVQAFLVQEEWAAVICGK